MHKICIIIMFRSKNCTILCHWGGGNKNSRIPGKIYIFFLQFAFRFFNFCIVLLGRFGEKITYHTCFSIQILKLKIQELF